MLILLRSDFRLPEAKEAFLRLMRYSHVNIDQPFVVPVVEAPGVNAIVLRLRKMQPVANTIVVMGTCKGESLEASLQVLDGVRKAIPYLAIFQHILLARRTEWREYAQVLSAGSSIECFALPATGVLVIEQRDAYSDLTHRTVLAHMLPRSFPGGSEGKARDGEQVTAEFRLDEGPISKHHRVTDEMLQQAGVPLEASLEPDKRERGTQPPPPPKDADKGR